MLLTLSRLVTSKNLSPLPDKIISWDAIIAVQIELSVGGRLTFITYMDTSQP